MHSTNRPSTSALRNAVALSINVCLIAALSCAPWGAAVRAQTTSAPARLLHTITDTNSYWWSPDGRTLAVAGASVTLYDPDAPAARAEIKQAARTPRRAIYFTPDSATLILHTDRVRLYDARDGRALREFAPDTAPIYDYQQIFTGHETSSYNAETNMTETGWEGPSAEEQAMELPMAYRAERYVSPDGRLLLVRAKGGRAQAYDLGTGELKYTLEPFAAPNVKHDEAGDALGEFSPDGRRVVTAHRNRTPRLWDAQTGALVANLGPQTGKVFGVRFSPDARFVVTSSWDGVVTVWDAATGRLRHSIGTPKDRHYFAAWNPRDDTFATKSLRWEIDIWHAETGARAARLDRKSVKEDFKENLTFEYSPDGRVLLTKARNAVSLGSIVSGVLKKGKRRSVAHLWDAHTGALVTSLRDTRERGADDYRFDKFFWTPTGDLVVEAGLAIRLWTPRGELRQELGGNATVRASLSPDGRFLAVTGDEVVTFGSMLLEAGKILVGRLPKLNAPYKTNVWQLGG